ncbi:alternative ribosome rescue aminoacyl-tRNA hydrolase ArfB, partial [Actinotalea sp. JY-7885]
MDLNLPRLGLVVVDDDELRWRFSRSSGPGGQGVNTTDSRVELSWDLARTPSLPAEVRDRAVAALAPRLVDGVLTVAASEHRSQLRNRQAATERLARLVAESLHEQTPRRAARPSRA